MDTAVFDLVKELQQIRIDIQNNQRKLGDTVQDSLRCVDELTHQLREEFDLTTAVALCKAGYFVKHIGFGSTESMHYYDGSLYYEDGTVVTVDYLMENGLSDQWHVKKNPLEIDLIKLRNMHAADDGSSYENCFK